MPWTSPTRAAVAARLARHLSPPLRVIEQLAADLPDVAAAVRAHPRLLPSAKAATLEAASAATIAADPAEVAAATSQVRKYGEDPGTKSPPAPT